MLFHQIIDKWAVEKPDWLAVEDGRLRYSFQELKNVSELFARRLIEKGLRPKGRVLIHTHKTSDLIVAVFAIMKAGGIYVPVDPGTPEDRLKFICNEITPDLFISSSDSYRELLSVPFVPINEIEKLKSQQNYVQDQNVEIHGDDVCYIIYTSGSTGKPKGVPISHNNVEAFMYGMEKVFIMNDTHRCINTTPYHFDGALVDTFYPLYRGASVFVFPAMLNPNLLVNIIAEKKITHFTAAVSVLTLLYPYLIKKTEILEQLKYIMTGAEVCDKKIINALVSTFNCLKIINGYGPTEATCDSLTYTISAENLNGDSGFYPIGRPLQHIDVILKQEFSDDIEGELLISGRQLFSGYYNRPEETKQVFEEIEGKIYYHTGDYCRRDRDGFYYYIGRIDDEVKHRGYRIHLNEIKEAVLSHAAINQCEVIYGDFLKEKCIVAIIESNEDWRGDEIIELKKFLRKAIPEYMVPEKIVVAKKIPLLPSLKTDRKLLKKIVKESSIVEDEYCFVLNEADKLETLI